MAQMEAEELARLLALQEKEQNEVGAWAKNANDESVHNSDELLQEQENAGDGESQASAEV